MVRRIQHEHDTNQDLRPAGRALTGAEQAHFTDLYIPAGYIPDVIWGRTHNLRDGCHAFGDVPNLAEHHSVYFGEAWAVEAQLRAGVTVRDSYGRGTAWPVARVSAGTGAT